MPNFEVKPANVRKNLDIYGKDVSPQINSGKKERENESIKINAAQKKINGSFFFNFILKISQSNQATFSI